RLYNSGRVPDQSDDISALGPFSQTATFRALPQLTGKRAHRSRKCRAGPDRRSARQHAGIPPATRLVGGIAEGELCLNTKTAPAMAEPMAKIVHASPCSRWTRRRRLLRRPS